MFSLSSRRLVLAASALAALSPLSLIAAQITLPKETAKLIESPLPGYALATASCATCHSADYIRTQPPMFTRATWTAEVTKMKKVYGAPFGDEVIDPIAEYLVKTYGVERPGADQKPATPAAQPAR